MSHSFTSMPHTYTLAQYAQLDDDDGYWSELSRGYLVREPQPGALHSDVVMELGVSLRAYVRKNDLGRIVVEGGFRLSIDPPTVRGPDIAFISKARLPDVVPVSWWPFAPDLAIEVVSPGRSLSTLQEKILEYFDAGTRAVWVIDLRTRSVTSYASLSDISIIRAPATLTGGELLPGFSLQLDALIPMP
ncbi:MAG TPA: Uma2 family endonuclease [Longimicrobiales bacterium]|nr:Uma2 family endonuclease [Longimicrobiales bacterium]